MMLSRLVCGAACCLALGVATPPARADIVGTYPEQAFHGMQIFFRLEGVTVKSAEERGQGGNTDNRQYHLEASVDGTEVVLQGEFRITVAGSYEWSASIHTNRFGQVPDDEPREKRVADHGAISSARRQAFRLVLPMFAGEQGVTAQVEVRGRDGTAGNRVVGVGCWAIRAGGPAAPLKTDTKLYRLLRLYQQRIAPGPVKEGGAYNNALAVLSDDYKPYTCGGFQAKVLAFLDGLRASTDPAERALLDDFDYGPIQSYFGGHQAVVLWRKGTTWTEDGLVLDPWITQTPEVYAMKAWAMRFSQGTYHGIGPSRTYNQAPNYPTHGGRYVTPGEYRLTPEERTWVASLPKGRREQLYKWPEHQRVPWIRTNYQTRFLQRQISAHCPVHLHLIDPQGRVSGIRQRELLLEIPKVQMTCFPTAGGSLWTQLEFPADLRLRLVVEAWATGSTTLVGGFGLDLDPASRLAQQQVFNLSAGEQASIGEVGPNAALMVAGQSLTPQPFTAANPGRLARLQPTPTYQFGEDDLMITGRPTPEPPAASPTGPAQTFFDNRNGAAVGNGPTRPTTVTFDRPVRIEQIVTYHWNSGRGQRPGQLSLRAADGTIHGPWPARALGDRQGDQALFWEANPNILVPAGTYQVIDSDPATWSHNAESGHAGMALVWGTPH